jgi:antitoxin (DNA-binding transcriptional repressor) of toxin-antitoxin stability system
MRALDRGEDFVITRNGEPVGELRPYTRRRFVPTDLLQEAFRNADPIDPPRFREDVDEILDQDPEPRV